VVVLLALALAGCGKVELYSNLEEPEANEMLALLYDSGINAEKGPLNNDGLVSLYVAQGDLPEATWTLSQAGYPKQKFARMGDLFAKDGLISSPMEERVRFLFGLSQELSSTLSMIDGVTAARVHVVLPSSEGVRGPVKPSSAAVFIKHQRNVDLDPLIPKIKLLVTNSIEGLVYENVTLILFPADPPKKDQAAPPMQTVAGVELAAASISQFWLILGSLCGLLLLAILGNGYFYYRLRRISTATVPAGAAQDGGLEGGAGR